MNDDVIFDPSQAYIIKLFLIGSIVSSAGSLVNVFYYNGFLCIVCGFVFLLGFFVLILALLASLKINPKLEFTQRGIQFRTLKYKEIKWDEIKEVSYYKKSHRIIINNNFVININRYNKLTLEILQEYLIKNSVEKPIIIQYTE